MSIVVKNIWPLLFKHNHDFTFVIELKAVVIVANQFSLHITFINSEILDNFVIMSYYLV